MTNPIIQLKDLTKYYGKKKAVDKLNLTINTGEIFGLLGPNGAGKTTSILMMLGLTEPTSGQAWVCGFQASRNPLEVKRRVGYLPDNVGFYTDMTALENLTFIAQLNNISEKNIKNQALQILKTVGLEHAAHQKAGTFSRGMKQRLALAEVLIKKPQVIILDEPTLGIDPSGVNEFLGLIKQLSKDQSLTVLMSSHHLHQVQQVCDRVGIFVDGKMIVEGPIDTLASRLMLTKGHKTVIEVAQNTDKQLELDNQLQLIQGYKSIEFLDGKYIINTFTDITPILVKVFVNNNLDILSVNRDGYTLDYIYSKYFDK